MTASKAQAPTGEEIRQNSRGHLAIKYQNVLNSRSLTADSFTLALARPGRKW